MLYKPCWNSLKTYGRPSKFGYKDSILMFKAGKFDPNEWAELFKKAGAELSKQIILTRNHGGYTRERINRDFFTASSQELT